MTADRRGARPTASVRSHVLLAVVAGALLPLGIVGYWLNSSAIRAGESLLQEHLEESVETYAAAMRRRWTYRNAELLLLADNEVTRRVIQSGHVTREDSLYLSVFDSQLETVIPSMQIRGSQGTVLWSADHSSRAARRGSVMRTTDSVIGPAVAIRLPVKDTLGAVAGEVHVRVLLSALLPGDSVRALVPGSRTALRDTETGESLVTVAAGALFPSATELSIDGQSWRAAIIRGANGPPLDIAVAAPLHKYVGTFQRNASIGLFALLAVSFLAVVFTLVLTIRVTRPIEQLASAADEVSRGKLELSVAENGPSEIRKLGMSFNIMTRSLRETLETLSRRNALAAAGEFATALSHDVRNALTSIKLDLRRAARRQLGDDDSRLLVERALNTVTQLEAAVNGALRVARGAGLESRTLDLRDAIRSSASLVEGTLAAVPAKLHLQLPGEPVLVRGDSAALEQLFANLLFNAAQALAPNGDVNVNIESDAAYSCVFIRDNGMGMSDDELRNLEKPFHSSGRNGTGLGLPIARQIAAAHGGDLEINSLAGRGTTIRVRIPVDQNNA